MALKGQTGASATLVKTPARAKRDRARREREERAWREKNGPVKSYIDKSIIRN